MAANTEYYIKQGDRRPYLQAQLIDESEVAVDLTAASSVVFHMDDKKGTAKITNGAVIVNDAVLAMVEYQWGATDTDTAGDYFGEFQVNWNDGTKSTFPNHKFIRIKIRGEVA